MRFHPTQVHQTKKSNKWECKLCSEKQSIKRHYGLGTGKECRLHVQKLNGICGELDELDKIAKLNESSDEEFKTNVPKVKEAYLESKWSEFVDKSENLQALEPESMYLGNAEVVLEVPAKRQKFNKNKNTYNYTSVSTNLCKTENNGIVQSPCDTLISSVKINCNKIHATSNQTESKEHNKQAVTIKNKLHTVEKNSKWSQYVDEVPEANDYREDGLSVSNVENASACDLSNGILKIDKNETIQNKPKDIPKNIFSLSDENDLDDVLDL